MEITVDVAYKSLNKYSEILCGDKVEILQTEDSNIMILADGMGRGQGQYFIYSYLKNPGNHVFKRSYPGGMCGYHQ